MTASATKTNYAKIWHEAKLAGEKAAKEATPTPIVVYEAHLDDTPVAGGKSYYVAGGVCGFATLVIKPATSGFARWLKANERTYKHYYGGLAYFIHAESFNHSPLSQSLEIKEAYARAMVKVLKENGINCGWESRLD